MDLKTNYMGVELKNPVIVGASNLVTDLKALKKIEEEGAAAVVYKTLFEEQIHLENLQNFHAEEDYASRHAEMAGSPYPSFEDAGPEVFLASLKEASSMLNIPLFASLNCVYDETWEEYAKKIEATGVAGLELNFYSIPRTFEIDGRSIITEQFDLLEMVKKAVKIPVAVKLSPYYANPLHVIAEMDKRGVDAFVLFNRLFQPEIDIDLEEHYFPYNLSTQNDNRIALRFAGLLHGEIKASICANTGIFTGEDVISMVLAGADTVQIVSTIYKNGIGQISTILKEVETWMKKKNYKSLDEFRGKLSRKTLKDPFTYKRAQYVDILMKSEEIFKKYPLI
ncbi:MAG TPA: dihydroorotate dehydrogenase-like protein [Bacteroidales bacterium]|nr:dihydroorotate dehydrogenase-like protein [Bacteroidales bacterium]